MVELDYKMPTEQKIIKSDFSHEQKLWRQGYDFVVGLDEVGRGPLAGPVCAAAVCLVQTRQTAAADLKTKNRKIKKFKNIRDSKKLSAIQRELWYEFLTTHPDIKWGIGLVSERVIDRINILEATKLAMKRALEELNKKLICHPRENGDPDLIKNVALDSRFRGNDIGARIDYLLLDGNFLLEDLPISQKAVTCGDEKIWSCAAASIIAKVARDRLMLAYHAKFPQYGFDKHKGYGTAQHLAAIKRHGPCSIHRRSFAPCKKK